MKLPSADPRIRGCLPAKQRGCLSCNKVLLCCRLCMVLMQHPAFVATPDFVGGMKEVLIQLSTTWTDGNGTDLIGRFLLSITHCCQIRCICVEGLALPAYGNEGCIIGCRAVTQKTFLCGPEW